VHLSCGLLSPLLLAKLADGAPPDKRTGFSETRNMAEVRIDRRLGNEKSASVSDSLSDRKFEM
jgi:hypothetical protein